MNQAEYFSTVLTDSLSTLLNQLAAVIPRLIAAVILFILGMILARWSKWLVVRLLRALGIKKVVKGSPLEKFLEKAEIANKIDRLIGDIVRWLILLVFAIASVNILGLETVSLLLTDLLTYLPNVLAAIIILVIGTLLAGIVESLTKGAISSVSMATARMVSRFASYLVMIFTLLAATAQLGIAENLIYILFIGFVAMLALGLGLAVGLGAKDLVSKILDEWYTNLKKDH